MKAVLNIALAFCLIALVFACSKSSDNTGSTTFTGKWKLTEVLADPGDGSGKFAPVTPKANYDYVQFNSNGSLSGTVLSDYVRYSMKDSVILNVFKSDNSLQNYRYKFHDGVLDLSPAGPIMCIEGCAQRFVKVSN